MHKKVLTIPKQICSERHITERNIERTRNSTVLHGMQQVQKEKARHSKPCLGKKTILGAC